jgi:hypothetical protein
MSNFYVYVIEERWKQKLTGAGYRIDESTDEERRVARSSQETELMKTDPPPSTETS